MLEFELLERLFDDTQSGLSGADEASSFTERPNQ
jgi:hypothetical protein